MGEKDVEEEEEEKVVKVEREVDVEKSNIRAMKVVCSLCVHEDVNIEWFLWESFYLGAIPGTLPITRGVQPFA